MSMHIPTSTKEIYTLRRKLLVAQYDLIVTPYKQFRDDRRIAYNSYHMMLNVCDEMIAADTIITSASIKVAVNKHLNEMCDEINSIIKRFNHVVPDKYNSWIPEED